MNKRILVLVLLILSVGLMTSCRSRRTTTPQPVPPVAETAPAPIVEATEGDFVAPEPEPDVLAGDIAEANRVARDRGWLRDAFFGYDAANLDAEAQEALRQSATWLRSRPEFDIRIEGHCDERGTEQYNLALGDRRAEAAAAYLVSLGVDRGRIRTISYGEERPFAEGANESAWSQNRRAHLVLAGRR